MSTTILAHAQNLDFDAFTQLNDVCFPHEPVTEYEFQEFLAANFWAIYEHERWIGFSVMTIGEKQAHIRRIGIHPDFRSQGLAQQLMGKMLAYAQTKGAHLIGLLVQQDNLPAIHLYRKYGFQVSGESVQFAVTITPMVVRKYAITDIEAYKNSESFAPHQPQILNWTSYHKPPHSLVLIFLREHIPVGFVRFSPDFPGCSPFELFENNGVDDIQILVSLLNEYALPHKTQLKITTKNAIAIKMFKSAGVDENYSLYEMRKTLG